MDPLPPKAQPRTIIGMKPTGQRIAIAGGWPHWSCSLSIFLVLRQSAYNGVGDKLENVMVFLETIYIIVGAALMALSGTALAKSLNYKGWDTLILVGFALGIVLLGQAPSWRLRAKVRNLERRLTLKS